jgi:hypothetical protein
LIQKQQQPLLEKYDETKTVEPMNVEVWLLSPYLVQREEFDRVAAKWGWVANTDQNEWLRFTDSVDGSALWAQVDWLLRMDGLKVQLHWQDPNVREAVLKSGRNWSDCWLLHQYALQKNLPGLMVQGWGQSTIGFEVLYAFAIKLSDEIPIAIVINEQSMHAFGDWEPYGGPPNFDAVAASFPAPEPEPEPPRTFHIGQQAFSELVITQDDYRQGLMDKKVNTFLRQTGNLAPEDDR